MVIKVTRSTVNGPVTDEVRVRTGHDHAPLLKIDAQDVVDGELSGGYTYNADLHKVTSIEVVGDHEPHVGSRAANELPRA